MPTRDFVLSHGDTPKSLNAGGAGSRAHWGVAHRQKKVWEGIWLAELLKQKVPKNMTHVNIAATIRWWYSAQPRDHDVDNYLPGLLKPLQDCLVKAGYIADDTPEFLTFTGLAFEDVKRLPVPRGTPRPTGHTSVLLTARYARRS